MKTLKIGADGFTLPLELVTSTQAILARKRSGKSYTASVEAEELLKQHQQIAVIDPTSAWWGLRSSSNGEGDGYPVVVFGGDHADAPLDFRAGKAMALALVEHGFSAIFDIGNLATEEQVQFVMDFCSELLRINRNALHVFMDEADTFAPQKPLGLLQNKCLGTVSRLVKQGGIRGVGFTMITQRPASINKDVLSQVDILTVLRMSHPLDIRAATDWIKSEVTVEFARDVEKDLPGLPVGTAYFCSASLGLGERVAVRQRRTFNSGATPKPGERKIEPKVMAAIDIEKLGKEISASVQRSKEASPEYLKQRIHELEQQAAQGGDVGFLEDAQAQHEELERLRTQCAVIPELEEKVRQVEQALAEGCDAIALAVDRMRNAAGPQSAYKPSIPVALAPKKGLASLLPPLPAGQPERATPRDSLVPRPTGGPEQRILAALSQLRGIGLTAPPRTQVCIFSGYSNMTSKGFVNAIGALRSGGMVEYPSSGTVTLTEAGLKAAPTPEPIRGNRELHERLFSMLDGPEVRVLKVVIEHRSVDRTTLAAEAGYTNLTSKGFVNSIGRLRTLGMIDYPSTGMVAATDLLFLKGQR